MCKGVKSRAKYIRGEVRSGLYKSPTVAPKALNLGSQL
jgi:hypothetical protein